MYSGNSLLLIIILFSFGTIFWEFYSVLYGMNGSSFLCDDLWLDKHVLFEFLYLLLTLRVFDSLDEHRSN